MSRVVKPIQLLFAYAVFNFKGAIAFRASFALQVFSMLFNDAIWVAFWLIYFAKFPVVQGWHRTDVLELWGIVAVSLGLQDVLFGNTLQLGRIVSEGELDIYLSHPQSPLFHVLISRQNVVGWGDILFGVIVLVVSIPWTPVTALTTGVSIIAGNLLFIGFVILTQSLVFFIGGREGLGQQLAQAFITFATYPIGIFHGILIRVILFGVIPAGLVSSLPAAIIDGVRPWMVWVALACGVAEVCLGRLVFYRGLTAYSSGNRMTIRV